MKGTIVHKDNELMVEYLNNYGTMKTVPIFKPTSDLTVNERVEFDIIDEFSHPQLFRDVALFDGLPCARINKRHTND